MADSVISCEHLTHFYGKRKIYEDLNFEVAPGRIVGLLGKNGTGKTTTINILMGYLVDADSRLHMLVPDGRVLPTGVTYVPEKEDLLVVGDLFYYTVKTSDDKGEHFWALRSSDFSPVASYERAYPSGRSLPGLRFTSSLDNWVKPRFK